MKKLSKVLSVICALVLVASLGVTAFAAGKDVTLNEGKGTDSATVSLSATLAEETPEYRVEISETDVSFTYSGGSAGTWKTDSHTYDPVPQDGTWTGGDKGDASTASKTINVINHSNVEMYCTAKFATNNYQTATSGVTLTLTGGEDGETPIVRGVLNDMYGSESLKALTVSLSGKPTENIDAPTAATITITISPEKITET